MTPSDRRLELRKQIEEEVKKSVANSFPEDEDSTQISTRIIEDAMVAFTEAYAQTRLVDLVNWVSPRMDSEHDRKLLLSRLDGGGDE